MVVCSDSWKFNDEAKESDPLTHSWRARFFYLNRFQASAQCLEEINSDSLQGQVHVGAINAEETNLDRARASGSIK